VSAARTDSSAASAPRAPHWLGELPPGFVLDVEGGACCAMRVEWAERLRAAGYGARGLDAANERAASTSSHAPAGRKPLLELRAGDARLLLRRHAHGGWLRWLTQSRFRDPMRPFRELVLARELERRGLPVAPVLAARAAPRAGGGWALELLSLRIAPALDLGELLDAQQAGRAPSAARAGARRALFEALGELVARMHALGLAHADLQPKNLLLELAEAGSEAEAQAATQPRLWILDLDRSRLQPELELEQRVANWARLERALEKRGQQALVSRSERGRVLRTYASSAGADASLGDARAWRVLWRRIAARRARSGWLHRLAWSLERRLGGTRAVR